MRFKNNWASFIFGIKLPVRFVLLCTYLRAIFQVQAPGEGFLCYRFGGLLFGGAHTWRGLFSEFYSTS